MSSLKFHIQDNNKNKKIGSVNISTKSSLAKSGVASFPITKNSQFAGSGASVTMTQPMFFSPLHTPQNWQIASKRREISQWCFTPETMILMSDGTSKPIKEIRPGDEVISHTGQKRKVLKTGKRTIEESIVKLDISGLSRPLLCTNNHKIWSSDFKTIKRDSGKKSFYSALSVLEKNKTQAKYVKSNDLKVNDVVFSPKLKPCNIAEKLTKEESFLIGLYLAEGGMLFYRYKGQKSPKGIRFCFGKDEKSLINKFEECCNSLGLKSNYYNNSPKGNNSWSVHIYNKEFANKVNNLASNGIYDKKLSEEVFSLSDNEIKEIISGYVSGDGHLIKNTGHIDITTANENLFYQIPLLLSRLGIETYLYEFFEKRSERNHYKIIINGNKYDFGIYKKLYTRKFKSKSFKSCVDTDFNFARRIKEKTSVFYSGDVYDIEVEEDHSYIAEGICVSNCRFYYENEPKVAAGVDFYAGFPMNGFVLECPSSNVLQYFDDLVEKLELNQWLNYISHEYFLLGDVFPFLEIECDECRGSGVKQNGEQCNHPGGSFSSIRVMNPDYIEVQDNVLAQQPVISMLPDEELKMIVTRKSPRQIYDNLPQWLIDVVMSGHPIPLSSRSVSHLKYGGAPYSTYGTPMLRRLFTILAYKTKLMTANWITAERLIIPVRVVKIGDEKRPASEEDIQDVVTQISAVANDPNLTIVTHHAFEYEWYGACHDDETSFFDRKRGLVKASEVIYEEFDKDEFEILVFDPETEEVRYEKPINMHVYDYEGDMIDFIGNKLDMSVTPNHKMLGYKRDKKTSYTMQAKDFVEINESNRYVRSVAAYNSEEESNFIEIFDKRIPVDIFMKFLGYYLSEGYCEYKPEKRRYIVSVSQSPKVNQEYCKDIDSNISQLGIKYSKYDYKDKATTWNFLQKDFSKEVGDLFGHNSCEKKIPQFIKNLPTDKLRILIDAFINGDALKYQYKSTNAIQIGTNSKQLSQDLLEIMFKCGLSPTVSRFKKDNKQYVINCNMTLNGKGRFSRVKKEHIHYRKYKGKVWCFETSTGFFVTERNGRISIQGNSGKIHNINNEMEEIGKEILDGLMINQAILNGDMSGYSSAQVGVEIMIRRLENWRNKLKDWVEKKIFKPAAMMQGFVDEAKSKKLGKTVYMYPKIKFNDMNLRDNTNFVQLLLQIYDKQGCSMQTILDEVNLDYDVEIERLRQENVIASASGLMPQGGPGGMGGGMAGGMGGPMGDMGGDMGGGMGGPMGDMGGGMEGMPPGGDMAGGMPMGGEMGAAAGSMPKIMKKGKGGKNSDSGQQAPQTKTLKLTNLESALYSQLSGMNLPFKLFGQYQFKVPGEKQPFVLDFALPELKIGLEADGAIWHERPDLKQRDAQRDMKLANHGWKILRFSEQAIKEHIDAVRDVIYKNVVETSKSLKKSSSINESILVKYASVSDFSEDLVQDFINIENSNSKICLSSAQDEENYYIDYLHYLNETDSIDV